MPYNFNECAKGSNPTKDKAREIGMKALSEMLTERYGAESVSLVDSNMYAVCLGTRTLADGTEGEVCITVEVVAKDFDVRVVESSGKVFQPYERLNEADAFEITLNERKAKAEQKAKEKQKREQARKAKKEQNKQENLGNET